jgi:hypothetical protein
MKKEKGVVVAAVAWQRRNERKKAREMKRQMKRRRKKGR